MEDEYAAARGEFGLAWSDKRRAEAINGMLAMVSRFVWDLFDHRFALDETFGESSYDATFVYRGTEVSIQVTGEWGPHHVFEFRVRTEYSYDVVDVKHPYFVEDVCERVREAADKVADMGGVR